MPIARSFFARLLFRLRRRRSSRSLAALGCTAMGGTALGWLTPRRLALGWLALLAGLLLAGPAQADPFDQLMADNQPAKSKSKSQEQSRADKGEVSLKLGEYQKLRNKLTRSGHTQVEQHEPRVVLGAAQYSGEIRDGVLELRGSIELTLSGGAMQVVPLIGSSLVLMEAKLDGQPIGLISRSKYHVWLTEASGQHTLTFRGLVAANGPRGSIEYVVGVARTTSTQVNITIPGHRVAPAIHGAVHSETIRGANSTTVKAALRPTTQLKLLGIHDFGGKQERDAKLFAESSSLLSVNDSHVELFTVIRYNILHASSQKFAVDIPSGFEVVDATGVGGFRYDIQTSDEGTRLLGRTSQPVHDRFELSLRLRKTRSVEEKLVLTPPRCLNVERQHGWLGVEVVGKLQLEVAQARELIDIDVRQLPAELVDSAVSPVLRAYRYIRDNPQLEITAKPLPELDLHNGNVDNVSATSVLADDGTLVTELKLTLRNRLRPTLSVGLAPGARVRSVLLDGKPVKASRDDEQHLVLPLIRSAGGERLKPFDVIVVWEETQPALGLWGQRRLALPAIDVEAASFEWKLYLPGGRHYSQVASPIGAQKLSATASWHKPAYLRRAVRWSDTNSRETRRSAVAGALPVRFRLPVTGIKREYQRYWVAAGESVELRVVHMRPWLWRLSAATCAAVLAWLMARLVGLWPRRKTRRVEGLISALLIVLISSFALWLALPGALMAPVVVAAALLLKRRIRPQRLLRIARVSYRRTPRAVLRWLRRPGWTPKTRVRAAAMVLMVGALGWKLTHRAAEFAADLLNVALG